MNKKLIPDLRFPEFLDKGNWNEKFLEEVADVNPTSSQLPNEFVYVDLESVENGVLLKKRIIKKEGAPSRAQRLLKDSDVIFQMVRPYQKNNYYFKKSNNLEYVASTGYAQLTAFESSLYLYQFIHTNNFVAKVLEKCTGSNYPAINSSDLSKILVQIPEPNEQQKIASCLSSIDEVITAHSQKLKLLTDHKKGLIQNLFPQEGETVPKYRFPEFKNDGKWRKTTIGEISKVSAGGTPESTNPDYWNGNIPWMNSGELNNKRIYSVSNFITSKGLKESSTKLIPPKCVLIGLAGQGKTRGTAAINYIELCTNQSIGSIHPNEDIFDSEFLYQKIDSVYDKLRYLSAGDGGRGGLNLQIIKEVELVLPLKLKEQQKIASCLFVLDELITAQVKKIEQLKEHKKGLMQGLFPKMND